MKRKIKKVSKALREIEVTVLRSFTSWGMKPGDIVEITSSGVLEKHLIVSVISDQYGSRYTYSQL